MKKLFHRTHEGLNAAYLHLHDPLSKSNPHESQQRGLMIETCIRILTSLGFLIHYPEGSDTVQELAEKHETGSQVKPPKAKALCQRPTTADLSNPWFPSAMSDSPHARTIKF